MPILKSEKVQGKIETRVLKNMGDLNGRGCVLS